MAYNSKDGDKVKNDIKAIQRDPGWWEGHGSIFEISSLELPEEKLILRKLWWTE